MSGTRRREQVLPNSTATPERRGDPTSCWPSSASNGCFADVWADTGTLVEERLQKCASVAELYDTALVELSDMYPSACVIALDVDAERITAHPSSARASSPAAATRAVERIQRTPVTLSHGTYAAVSSHRRAGHDPLADVLRVAIGLSCPAIGRIRLSGSVVALLVVDQRTLGASTDREAHTLQRLCDLVSSRAELILDSVFAELARESAAET